MSRPYAGRREFRRLMHTLTRHRKLAALERIEARITTLSPFEWLVFCVFAAAAIFCGSVLLVRANAALLVDIPARGGSITEGIVGSPRFINPLLAITDADRDLTTLVYAGLMKARPDGTLETELAESYEISEDRLAYTFTIREGARFHDGTPVTAEDVVFTITRAQDPSLKSPQRARWDGVSVEQIDTRTVTFRLNQPYAPFLENATIGILPKHIWVDASSEQFPFSSFNTEPIGAGPLLVDSITRSASGIPTAYELAPFEHYVLGEPFLDSLTIKFYPSETAARAAYTSGNIDQLSSVTPHNIDSFVRSDTNIVRAPLPRIFGVFFNQNRAEIFTNRSVRRALDRAIDKDEVVAVVLGGFGTPLFGPLPPGIVPADPTSPVRDTQVAEAFRTSTTTSPRTAAARDILERGGWEYNDETGFYESDEQVLRFTLTTSSAPELKAAAQLVVDRWRELGADVSLNIFEVNDLNQNIIRPRQYDALLFGEVVGREVDLFSFWHSSQRNDPGLNIALYANITADDLLEEARAAADTLTRAQKYRAVAEEIENDVPAVFLYAPDFIYLVEKGLSGVGLSVIAEPSERFANIHRWHTTTDRVWNIFAQYNTDTQHATIHSY